MIIHVFGEVKSRWEQYIGEEGLRNAVLRLRAFKDKNQRVPRVRKRD